MKVLNYIGGFYKYMAQQMGYLGLLLLLVLGSFLYGGIDEYLISGDLLIFYCMAIFLTILHVAFFVDKIKTEKRMARIEALRKKHREEKK